MSDRGHSAAQPVLTGTFRELGRRLSNWARWGDDDALGTLNLITPAARAAAARLVRTGDTVPLGLAFDGDGPQFPGGQHQNPIHMMTRSGESSNETDGVAVLDDAVFMHTRCATHVDALGHVAYDGLAYNGHPVAPSSQASRARLGIEAMRPGIQGRGVLLDLPWSSGRDRLDAGEAVGANDLDRAAVRQGVRIREGDILLLRTGWMSVFTRDRDRERYFGSEPGLELEAAEWLHDRGIAFLAADNWGIEVSAAIGAAGLMPLRSVLIRDMGMPLGKMFDLDELAEHCRASGVWEFQFTCLPLPITAGIGSPVAPIASF